MSSNTLSMASTFDRLVLSCIFDQLSADCDYKALARCLRVCRIWEEETRCVLYFQLGNDHEEQRQMLAPDILTLLYMPTSCERKQLYAQAVRILILDYVTIYDLINLRAWKGRITTQSLIFKLVNRVKVMDQPSQSRIRQFGRRTGTYPPAISEPFDAALWSISQLSRTCPRLSDLRLSGVINTDLPQVIPALSGLKRLELVNVRVSELPMVFDAVARHQGLQYVDGLAICASWVKALVAKRISGFRSVTCIGLIHPSSSWQTSKESNMDYIMAVSQLIPLMPKVSALKIDTTRAEMLDALTTLHKIHELTIENEFIKRQFFARKVLVALCNMKHLRKIHLPCFSRVPDHSSIPEHDKIVSWRVVKDFIASAPHLEELSFAQMYIYGTTLDWPAATGHWIPVTWKRGLGWEIEVYDRACKASWESTGRNMAHDYFGLRITNRQSFIEHVKNAERSWASSDERLPDICGVCPQSDL